MRKGWPLLMFTAAIGAGSACSGRHGLRLSRDAGGSDAVVKADSEAAPSLGPETGSEAAGVSEVGADVGGPPDAGLADAPISAGDVGGDATVAVWPGPDASITIGTAPVTPDGGIYPQVYSFPGIALGSHSKMFATEPDISFRIDEIGQFQYVDLNSDGLGDVVVSYGTTVSFYLQQVGGTFRRISGITLQPNDWCERYAVADFNGDGLADLAMIHFPGPGRGLEAIAIHLQASDGFHNTPDQEIGTATETNVTCSWTYFFAATDMNADGQPDLVALTELEYNRDPGGECGFDTAVVQVFLQDAAGAFPLSIGFSPRSNDAICRACGISLGIGDFNNDGQKDFAVIQNGQVDSSNADYVGREVLTYPRTDGTFATAPAQVLKLNQYLKAVSFTDVNADGRLDLLARSADWGFDGPNIGAANFTPGLTGVFLQKDDGTFADARTVTLDGWLPADTDPNVDPMGIDIRDVDLDGVRDLVVERKSVAEGLFRQEQGLFATTPDLEVKGLFPDWVSGAKQPIAVTYILEGSTITLSNRFNHLTYAMADMNGDGRPDIVAAYQPFAPSLTPDPTTGVYPSYPGLHPNTYTQLRVYLQRPIARRFAVEIQQSRVSVEQRVLHVQATLHNLAGATADNVRVRVIAAASPVLLQTTQGILAGGADKMAAFGADWVAKTESRIKGDPLGPDILIPRIEAGETIPLAIDIPVALVPDLDVRCLFLLVDPDDNTNLIYRRKYDFIAPN